MAKLRLIIRTVQLSPHFEIESSGYRTFDIDAPAVVDLLTQKNKFFSAAVCGAEVIGEDQ